jgi:hypothetical protein
MSNFRRGFSLVSVTLVTAAILGMGLALLAYVFGTRQAGKTYSAEISASQIAEAGLNKAMFCFNASSGTNCNGTYGASYIGESNVAFAGGKYTVTVIGSGPSRTVVAAGTDITGRTTTIRADISNIPPTDEPDFSFALQAGNDGIYMGNNSGVVGTVYSNGDVICQGTAAVVDGDAYVTKTNGLVDTCTVNFHAHADRILNSKVDGDAYYAVDPSGISGTNVKGTKHPGSATPPPKDLPDIDLAFWRAAAEAGGTLSGEHHPADNSSLGPKKINGDLIFDNNVDVTVTGPIWVTGDLILNNNATLTLHSSYGPYGTVILADHQGDPSSHGKITMVPGSDVIGSGNPKSHILLCSTNTSMDPIDPAIDVSNNAAGAVFLALDGIMRLNNNANAKSMAARKLYLNNNAVVTYMESEMSDMKFSNSPSTAWHVVEGSWRQAN